MKNASRKPTLRPAFTLIEMLVTITIIVILAGISIGGFTYVTAKKAAESAKIQVQLLSQTLEDYKLDNGTYPPSDGDTNPLFQALYQNGLESPDTEKIYLPDLDPENDRQGWIEGTGSSARIVDPWGNEYIYRNPPEINPDFDLFSKGPDGETSENLDAQETEDDIGNF